MSKNLVETIMDELRRREDLQKRLQAQWDAEKQNKTPKQSSQASDEQSIPFHLRKPEHMDLPPEAFSPGQDPNKWKESKNEIDSRRENSQTKNQNTSLDKAMVDQSRPPKNQPPELIAREEPSQVLSQQAAMSPQAREAQRTGKRPPLFAPEPFYPTPTGQAPTGQASKNEKPTVKPPKSGPANPDRATTSLEDQIAVAKQWAAQATTPEERRRRDETVRKSIADEFGRKPKDPSSVSARIEARRQKDFEAWDRGDPGSTTPSGVPVTNPLSNEELYTKDELGFDPKYLDKVAVKVGFDPAISKSRTAEVLRYSQRAERLRDANREAERRSAERFQQDRQRARERNTTLFREWVDEYKEIMKQKILI